ncbi:MAG: phosphatase [Bacteroidales bacterium]|nr:phosphatase [Bacteroidales bacterium]
MRVAIIDMGTNTFNLLIAETNGDSSYNILHNGKYAVKLGEGGIDKKFIAPEAWNRGLAAIESHINTISSFNVEKIFAFATSATRDAENGAAFVNEIYNRHKLKVDVIAGETEARFIYQGVKQAIDLGNSINLVLDIGGGSNELILCNAKQAFWMHSFNLGVQRLLQQFKPSDPITPEEVIQIELFLDQELKLLFEASISYLPIRLIGSSGSFDTFRSLLTHAGVIPFTKQNYAEIPLSAYNLLHQTLLKSTRVERVAMKGMESIRVDFIVIGSIFTNYIIKRLGITSIYHSEFALKEGVLWELMDNVHKT